MENSLEVKIKKFKYESRDRNILTNVNFTLNNGSILWLQGAVGCGKTTLLKVLSGIIPNFEKGFLDGEIKLNGESVNEKKYSDITFCFQHSDNQMLFDSVQRQFFEDEKILLRFLQNVSLIQLKDKSIMDLSRGQRKFVALMSTIRKKRKVYIFDEPLDLLDGYRKKIFLEHVQKISKNSIVIISSHDNDIGKIANRYIRFDKHYKGESGNIPKSETTKNLLRIPSNNISEIVLKTRGCRFLFEGNNEMLEFPNVKIYKNEVIGLAGNNGSGKTTFLKLIFGDIKSLNDGTEIYRKFNNPGFMFQNVNRQLFESTVYEELFVGLSTQSENLNKYADMLLRKLGLLEVKDLHPIFLSGGQKQKLVFASLLMHKPDMLLLDEIFTNLDKDSINSILELIVQYRKENDLTVILTDQEITHLEHICERIIHI